MLLGSRVITAAMIAGLSFSANVASAQQVMKDPVAGVRNLARLETTVACAGAINAEQAVPEIRKMGFVSIINLREAAEAGAEVEKEAALARRRQACVTSTYPSTARRRIRRRRMRS